MQNSNRKNLFVGLVGGIGLAFRKQLLAATELAERRFEQFEISEQDWLGHQCSRFLWKRPPFITTERCWPSP